MVLEVLETFHGQATDFDGNLEPEAVQEMERRVEELARTPKEGEVKPRFASLQAKYMASRTHALGSDHALRSISDVGSLRHFQVEALPGVLKKR